jgi:hypothetical protein
VLPHAARKVRHHLQQLDPALHPVVGGRAKWLLEKAFRASVSTWLLPLRAVQVQLLQAAQPPRKVQTAAVMVAAGSCDDEIPQLQG